jgi:hypothetical protein
MYKPKKYLIILVLDYRQACKSRFVSWLSVEYEEVHSTLQQNFKVKTL